jgi:hypothetical protein
MSYLIGFFLPLAGLAILIFLLSLLMQYSIYGNISKQGGNAEVQDPAADEEEGNINQTRRDPIADAIHAYRRSRRTDEGERAQRERVTIVVLGVTAIFAFLAAAAAGYSAWIFLGQLGEMHQASIDTAALVRTASDTEHRQLRAYVGPVFDSFKLTTTYADCDPKDTTIAPHTIFCYQVKNYGLTPARVPHNCFVIYLGPIRRSLNETKNAVLAGCAPNPLPTSPTIWPTESRVVVEANQFQEEIASIMAGNFGFLFGKLTYYDVFGDFHYTDTCRHIIHDAARFAFNPCRIEGQQDN